MENPRSSVSDGGRHGAAPARVLGVVGGLLALALSLSCMLGAAAVGAGSVSPPRVDQRVGPLQVFAGPSWWECTCSTTRGCHGPDYLIEVSWSDARQTTISTPIALPLPTRPRSPCV